MILLLHTLYRVFSLNFWWEGLKILVPIGPRRGQSRMGGTCEKNMTEAKTSHLMQNYAIFCYLKHEIQLSKVLLSLKVVKFDTKMYLNFSNFRGRALAGGGQSLVQKRGQVSDGGDWQNFHWMGDPQSPQEKKTCLYVNKINIRLIVMVKPKINFSLLIVWYH